MIYRILILGSKVKSKRNLIVQVPSYIREVLIKRDSNYNVFSNSIEPYNKGYFSLIWKRFKRLNPDVKQVLLSTLLDTQEP